MDEIIRYAKKRLMRFVLFPLKLLRIRSNRILLIDDMAQKFTCNLKYIGIYLANNYKGKFEIFASVSDAKKYRTCEKYGISAVSFNSAKYFLCAMTARVIVSNSGGYSYIPLHEKTMVINTHHGGGAYKKTGTDMFEDTKLFRKDLRMSSSQTDLYLSTCKKFSNIISVDSADIKSKIWEIGMPRNDILLTGNDQLKRQVRDKLGIKHGEKLVLYAPTYRKPNDNYFKESIAISYGIDSQRVCEALEKRFGGKWIFAMRLHPCIVNRQGVIPEGAMDLSDYEDMQELLLAADAMINDFSSSMWDFMLTGKPSFMYAVDLQHYVETTEVYTPVEEWPFPKSTNNEELVNNILNFDEIKYEKDCKRHYEALGGCETGHACELVCQRIAEVCEVK